MNFVSGQYLSQLYYTKPNISSVSSSTGQSDVLITVDNKQYLNVQHPKHQSFKEIHYICMYATVLQMNSFDHS